MQIRLKANECYQATLENYKKKYFSVGPISLKSYCSECHVNYKGMLCWMVRNNYKASEVRRQLLEQYRAKNSPSESNAKAFIRVTPESSPRQADKLSKDIPLEGIVLTFGDDISLSIAKATPENIIDLVTMYKKQIGLCSL